MVTEVRQLSLHPMAIYTFIKAQAGSLGKALSEAVMNSVDAFAQNIHVHINEDGFIIEDDGQGFRSRDEIAAWFETLGFPHDDGNHRVYGKFGMGRAQMWAYASTTWRSNEFVMDVDVQQKGLNYELHVSPSPVQGTRIEAKFYQRLAFHQLETAQRELQALVRYVPRLVTLNDRAVSRDASTETWDLETELAWYRFDKKMHTLDVYNGGVLVSHFPKYRFRCSGVVVTKPEHVLALNLARNDILEAECKVWPRIAKHLRTSESSSAPVARKPRPEELEAKARLVASGTAGLKEAMEDMPLVTSVYGRAVGYSDLCNSYISRPVVFTPKMDEFGKRLAKLRMALVLDSDVKARFGLKTAEEFKQMLLKHLEEPKSDWMARVRTAVAERTFSDDAKTLFPELAGGRVIYARTELDAEGKAAAHALDVSTRQLGLELERLQGGLPVDERLTVRGAELGDSPTSAAWVSDRSTLVVRLSDIKKVAQMPMPRLQQHLLRLLREAMADKLGQEEADRLLMRLLVQTEAPGAWTVGFVAQFASKCREYELPAPKTHLADLMRAGVE